MENLIFEPLQQYKTVFKPEHKQNVAAFFEELVVKSGVNEAENKKTVADYKVALEKLKKATKLLNNFRLIKTILTILSVVSLFVGIFLFYLSTEPSSSQGAYLGSGIGLVVVFIGFLLLVFLVLRPRIKNAAEITAKLQKQVDDLLRLAWEQMQPLLALFDATMTPKLVQKTVPLLTMDPYFDSKRFDYLHRKYNLSKLSTTDESVEFVQSGEISGNPFILARILKTHIGQQTYTGTLVVTYTVTVMVNNKPTTQVRSQTLSASVVKPKPFYHNDTVLIYGNEAAERLSFSRNPVVKSNWTEKSLRSLISSEEKKMNKLAADSLKKGKNFTPLGNSTFDALFQAYDRDHETQFRLLFTPLAQREMINLLKDREIGFGDNFKFVKRKNINEIYSMHSQAFDYSANPRIYSDYELAQIRTKFNEYNNDYLHRFYFNMAPVLIIPLYQQHKPHEFIYETEYESHLSFYEHEATANQFNKADIVHKDTQTNAILKTRLINKGSDFDIVEIKSYSYRIEKRVDYIMKTAANGSRHSVPVYWDEYIPLENSVTATIKVATDETQQVYRRNDALTQLRDYLSDKTGGKMPISRRHVFAFLLAGSFSAKDNDKLNNLVSDFSKEN